MSTCPKIPPTPLVAPSLLAAAPCKVMLPYHAVHVRPSVRPSVLFTRSLKPSFLTFPARSEATLIASDAATQSIPYAQTKSNSTTPGYHIEYRSCKAFYSTHPIPSHLARPQPPFAENAPCYIPYRLFLLHKMSSPCVPPTPPCRKVNQGKICAESLVMIIGKVMNAVYFKFS